VEINLTPGQDADISQAEPMLENIDPDAFLAAVQFASVIILLN